MEKSYPGKEDHPPSQVNFSEHLYENGVNPFAEPRADNSACTCSDFLALTKLTYLGEPKCSHGEYLAWLGG